MKFAVGDKVVEKAHLRAHTNWLIHKVVAILDGVYLTEFWGDGFAKEIHPYEDDSKPGSRSWRSSIQKFQESELISVEEAQVELSRLEEEKSKLESEFEGVRELVQKNLNDAAKLVRGAAELVKKTGSDKDFYDLVEEGKQLYLALNEGGWSHSTMRCRYGR